MVIPSGYDQGDRARLSFADCYMAGVSVVHARRLGPG